MKLGPPAIILSSKLEWYFKKYYSIIEKFRSYPKVKNETHAHHVFPKALGGTECKLNLVNLPVRYHFVAPLLLAKIFGKQMIFASYAMANTYNLKVNSRIYEFLRTEAIKLFKEYRHNQKTKEKMRKKKTEEGRRNIGLAQIKRWDDMTENEHEAWYKQVYTELFSKKRVERRKEEANKRGSWYKNPERTHLIMVENRPDYSGKSNPFFGKTQSDETKSKIGANIKLFYQTEKGVKVRKENSLAASKKFKGIPKSKEQKEKMKQGALLRWKKRREEQSLKELE